MQLLIGLLPVIVRIGLWFLDKSAASIETKKAFLEAVKKAGNDFSSARLLKLADEQLEWLKNDIEWKETK